MCTTKSNNNILWSGGPSAKYSPRAVRTAYWSHVWTANLWWTAHQEKRKRCTVHFSFGLAISIHTIYFRNSMALHVLICIDLMEWSDKCWPTASSSSTIKAVFNILHGRSGKNTLLSGTAREHWKFSVNNQVNWH